jgi:hypothetical protein
MSALQPSVCCRKTRRHGSAIHSEDSESIGISEENLPIVHSLSSKCRPALPYIVVRNLQEENPFVYSNGYALLMGGMARKSSSYVTVRLPVANTTLPDATQ